MSTSPLVLFATVLATAILPLPGGVSAQAPQDVAAPVGETATVPRQPGSTTQAPSLAGPRAEVAFGALLLAATPFVAATVALAVHEGPLLSTCEDWHTGEEDPVCRAEEQAQAGSSSAVAVPVGIALAVVGTALLGHGIFRLRRARRERRVRFETARIHVDGAGGHLRARFSF